MKGEEEAEEKKMAKKKDKNLPQTKVIIRRLPYSMTEESFLEYFDPFPNNDYFRFVSGDRTLAPHSFCRAYINFTNPEDIISFRDRYDGFAIEANGQSSVCVVEFAPFQKTGRRQRKKEDQKSDTILQDSDYKKFIESLEQMDEKDILDVEQYLDELEAREKSSEPVDTPLTSFLKQRREEKKRVREERRKMEMERRKKREEERRKKKDAEKKKRIDVARTKKLETARNDYDGKKTLAETRPSSNGKSSATTEKNEAGDDGKVKILQKEQKEGGGRHSQKEGGGGVKQQQQVSSSNNRAADSRYKQQQQQTSSGRDLRKWKGQNESGASSGGNKEQQRNDDSSRYNRVQTKEFKRSYRPTGYYRQRNDNSASSGGGGRSSRNSEHKSSSDKY